METIGKSLHMTVRRLGRPAACPIGRGRRQREGDRIQAEPEGELKNGTSETQQDGKDNARVRDYPREQSGRAAGIHASHGNRRVRARPVGYGAGGGRSSPERQKLHRGGRHLGGGRLTGGRPFAFPGAGRRRQLRGHCEWHVAIPDLHSHSGGRGSDPQNARATAFWLASTRCQITARCNAKNSWRTRWLCD
jgi:hypothetical protein